MHNGKLSPEARARRVIKNLRNRNRVHPTGAVHELDMPAPGAFKRVTSRLFLRGNREKRGRA